MLKMRLIGQMVQKLFRTDTQRDRQTDVSETFTFPLLRALIIMMIVVMIIMMMIIIMMIIIIA